MDSDPKNTSAGGQSNAASSFDPRIGGRMGNVGGTTHNAADSTPDSEAEFTSADALKAAFAQFQQLLDFTAHYLAAKRDQFKLTLRNAAIFAILGAVALIACAAAVVTAVVYVMGGIAGALGNLFGGRLWLGELVVGLLALTAIVATAYIFINRIMKTGRARVARAYEHRKSAQRSKHGVDVEQRGARVN